MLSQEGELGRAGTLATVSGNGIEVSSLAKGALLALVDPGGDTVRVVVVSAVGSHVATALQTDRTVLVAIQEHRGQFVHVVVVEIHG